MNSPSLLSRTLRAYLASVLLAGASAAVLGQAPGTGIITGRVQDSTGLLSLERARVSIEGTSREAFTDAFGEYRLPDVPAGTVTLRVLYTGRAGQSGTVAVPAGGVAQRDFRLEDLGGAPSSSGVIKLDQFVVADARETNAAAIAMNEQRFAASAKTVVSTDALGIVAENNIGEFAKFLPGVEVVTDQMNAVAIQLRGMPQVYTGISIDGEPMNVASTSGPSRATSLQTISLANATRIEVYKVPTPDMPASSLGGSINLVSRTAFEKSKPEFQFRTFLNKNSHFPTYAKAWANDGDDTSRNFLWGPGFDFTYTVPLSKNFGFSVNAVKFDQFNAVRQLRRTFNTTTLGTNPLRATVDNPYLQSGNYLFSPSPRSGTTWAFASTGNFRRPTRYRSSTRAATSRRTSRRTPSTSTPGRTRLPGARTSPRAARAPAACLSQTTPAISASGTIFFD